MQKSVAFVLFKCSNLRNFALDFMKKVFIFLYLLCACSVMGHAEEPTASASARVKREYQGPEVTKFAFETRFGWQMVNLAGQTDDNATGFRGEFINLSLNARIYKGLSISWRQRFNRVPESTFWDATDWLEMNYAFNGKWSVSAGKQVVAIGGYEYDRPPIDLYNNNSEYWNHIACYQLGASVTYKANDNHRLTFQVSNSPFRKEIGSNNTYGLSLMWNGKCGMWETIWSVNAFQCTKGRWMNYIALGNKFNFLPQRLWLELDYVNRASSGQAFFFEDCSVIAELSGKPHSSVRVFAKYNYDVNNTGTDADLYVMNGTEMHGVSGGIEYEPFKKHPEILRLFAAGGYSWGVNTNPGGAMLDDQVIFNVGAKVNLDVLKGLKWAINKW